MTLRPDQIEEYIASGSGRCPYCGTPDEIEGVAVNIRDTLAYQEVHCLLCEASWWDVYTLSDIEEDEP